MGWAGCGQWHHGTRALPHSPWLTNICATQGLKPSAGGLQFLILLRRAAQRSHWNDTHDVQRCFLGKFLCGSARLKASWWTDHYLHHQGLKCVYVFLGWIHLKSSKRFLFDSQTVDYLNVYCSVNQTKSCVGVSSAFSPQSESTMTLATLQQLLSNKVYGRFLPEGLCLPDRGPTSRVTPGTTPWSRGCETEGRCVKKWRSF